MLLVRLKGDSKSHQYYIYQIIKADLIYIQILVNSIQEVLYIRFRMANQNKWLMQVEDYQEQHKIILSQT